ncbi:MAG TPA: hypothetical protein VG797_02975 [Phycisphaerales bacterium]|nr:hypothetical protein [Phycisphaerales bacterium]
MSGAGSDIWLIVIQVALPLVTASAFALLLRWARVPGEKHGAAIVGGVVAGLLLGPGIFGRVYPARYEALYVGGVAERNELDDLRARQAADLTALRAAGVTPVAVEEAVAGHKAERAPVEVKLSAARAGFSKRVGLIGAAAVMLGVCLSGVFGSIRQIRKTTRTNAGVVRAIKTGVAALALAAAPWVAIGLFSPGSSSVVALSTVFSIPALIAADRGNNATARRAMLFPGAMMSAIAIAGFADVKLVALVIILATVAGPFLPVSWVRRGRRAVMQLLLFVLVPFLACFAMLSIDVREVGHRAEFWALGIAALLLAADGRWFAVWAAGKMARMPPAGGASVRGSWGWSRAARIAVGPGVGAVMIGGAILFHAGGKLSDAAVVAAVIGAVAAETTRGLRESVARMMDAGRVEV